MIDLSAALGARPRLAMFLAVTGSLVLALALQQDRLLAVWRHGWFFDTDDAMRMAQVRDLLAGQNWFDLTQRRLDPPAGSILHWSRLVDLPILVLLKICGWLLPAEMAERAARIAFPTLTLGVLLAGGGWAANIFAGASARLMGVFAMLFCGVAFWQFPPGRIDHHAPQITLLLFCVVAMARAFDPAQALWAALAGACMAVSIGIGLENLPFFAIIAAAPGLAFVLHGAEARGLLRAFAGGLALTLLAVFFLTIGQPRWFVPACDALSAPWLAVALEGAAVYGLLSLGGGLDQRWRLAALAALGVLALAPLVLLWPQCFASPYGAVDPLVKSLWLDHVSENITLRQNFVIAPGASLLLALPTALGLLSALIGATATQGVARARWQFLAALVGVGFVAASLSLRVFSSTMPLAGLGMVAAASLLARNIHLAVGAFALFGLSSFGLALALPDMTPPHGSQQMIDMAWRRPDPCLESASYEPMAFLSPGLAVAQIPSGSYLIAHTRLSVLAAPYHRNNHGNRAALDILRSPPALAELLARKAGAKYVILCWATPADEAALQLLGPDALAAQLARGATPNWLRPIRLIGTPFHVYGVAAWK